MATPDNIQGIMNTDLISTLDLDIPQKRMNAIFRRYGTQGLGYLTVRSLGFEKPVKNDTYYHYEKSYSHDYFKVQSTVTQAVAGASIDLVLHSDSLDANNDYYPRENDVVMFSNEVVGWIDSIAVTGGGSTVTLTIKPNLETDTIGTVSAGDTVIIISGMFSEGSGMPDEATSETIQYTNNTQIIKEAIGATGTSLVTESWIEIYNRANEFQGVYYESFKDLDYRMLTKIDGMFWWGKRVSTTGSRAEDSVTGHDYHGSEGLIPAIRRAGNTNTYTPGSFAVTKFDTYERTLAREFVSQDIPVWCPMGLQLYQEVENTLKTYFEDTNIQFAQRRTNDMLFNSNESLGASVNFKYLTKSGRTYLLHNMLGWSNPKTYGATGYDMEKMGLIVPLDKKKDPKTKEDIPSIGVRYRAMGNYNRRLITDTLSGIGATAPNRIPVNTIDKTKTYQLADMGNEFYGLNRFLLIDNA